MPEARKHPRRRLGKREAIIVAQIHGYRSKALIVTDARRDLSLPNSTVGIAGGSHDNKVGVPSPLAGNFLSGNLSVGSDSGTLYARRHPPRSYQRNLVQGKP